MWIVIPTDRFGSLKFIVKKAKKSTVAIFNINLNLSKNNNDLFCF